MERLRSRKLWVATISAVVMWVSVLAGVEFDVDQAVMILSPIVAYLLGQSWVDAKKP